MANISSIFDIPFYDGFMAGIEVETELDDAIQVFINPEDGINWRVVHDGSLRGNGIEWVMRKPTKMWENDLEILRKILKETGTRNITSPRCGVHVHVNVSDLEREDMWKVIGMSIVMENLLLAYSGESREHNLFCLGCEDAEGSLLHKRRVYQDITFAGMHDRYAAINLASIAKYGTIEYRSMRTPHNIESINGWVSLLKCCYDEALKYDSVKDIPLAVSMGGGGEEFVKHVLGPELFKTVADTLGDYDYDYSIMRGVRNLQDVLR